MHSYLDDFECLVDGKNAFPEIISCINNAQRSIYINMFIWRDDRIGNAVARAIFDAANRGVRVYLSIDRVGAVLEGAEEYCTSFFHRKYTFVEKIKIGVIKLLYPSLSAKKKRVDCDDSLYNEIINHPNVTASTKICKADHSKYYIFDDEVLILGGINVEDKENSADISDRVYQDYMVKITGADHVKKFKNPLKGENPTATDYGFCINSKECKPRRFELEGHYLDLIGQAQSELLIIMAYFSPPKEFLTAIADAHRRGANVTLMLPADSNLNKAASLHAAKRLMRATDNGINLYLSPKMLHTKLIANEKTVSMGSANMMKNTFKNLSELNLFFPRCQHPFTQCLFDSIDENLADARKITAAEHLRYSPFKAWLEENFV